MDDKPTTLDAGEIRNTVGEVDVGTDEWPWVASGMSEDGVRGLNLDMPSA